MSTEVGAGAVPELGGVAGTLLDNGHTRLACYTPDGEPLDWVRAHRDELLGLLDGHGAVLLRGLPAEVGPFEAIAGIVGGELLNYTERSTPRTSVAGRVYTSTEYPPDQTIPMHNESSYSDSPPGLLFFQCQIPAGAGGATPIADGRAVFRLLPEHLRERLRGGVTYTRTYRAGVGLSWQEAFQTEDRAQVQDYCDRHGISTEWAGDELRTSHHRPAFGRDPGTGQELWFNQANLFHVASLEPDLREALLEMYGEDGLPRHARYGDGSPIDPADLDHVRAVFDEVSLVFPWQAGDLLMVRNLLVAHGRQPYTGDRRVLVAMTG